MSCLVADPWFARGTTLGVSSADDGRHIVGTQREFLDTAPNGTINSNATVRCVAMRNNSGGTLTAGKVVKGKDTALLSEVDGNATADSPVVGVVDEYLTAPVANNDIFWLVIAGPTTADSSGAIAQAAYVSVGTGALVASVANKTAGVALAAASGNKVRVLLGLNNYSTRSSTPTT